MESPELSIESLPRANSAGSFGDHVESYQSLSPLEDLSVGSSPPASDSVDRDSDPSELYCEHCKDPVSNPKLLSCFHTFCNTCLEKTKSVCPRCNSESLENIITSLLFTPDTTAVEALPPANQTVPHCTGCKHKKLDAVARCFDCSHFICLNCVMAHQHMHCFETHRVLSLPENNEESKNGLTLTNNFVNNPINGEKTFVCQKHKPDLIKYYCLTCAAFICKECLNKEHYGTLHDCELISDLVPRHVETLQRAVAEAKARAQDIKNTMKNGDHLSNRLQVQFHKSQSDISETFQFYRSLIEEQKEELLKELTNTLSNKQVAITVAMQKAQDNIDSIYRTCELAERLMKSSNSFEIITFKKIVESKFLNLLNSNVEDSLHAATHLEFVSNYQAIQAGVRNTFGYIRSDSESTDRICKQPPIARPIMNSGSGSGGGTSSSGSSMNGSSGSINTPSIISYNLINSNHSTSGSTGFESNLISKRFHGLNSFGPFTSTVGEMNLNPAINLYEKWSNGGSSDSMFSNGGVSSSIDAYSIGNSTHSAEQLLELTKLSVSMFPPKSQIKRQKMIYHCKFGEFGVLEGQFTEPSGVAVNAQNDIIVADTNNHRIQMFDKEGRFKFYFGECGKRDGQLLYPNRVAVVRTSGDIIVTERSPTHQIQIYNQYGQFVRKFGANILQHPRGVTVDNKGRIVVVECKVMRVIIFDQMGTVIHKFGCSKHLEFPNGVVVNDKQEIFISDNRAHCVKVFNYEGIYLRQIGGEGITNYPIGVGINSNGEILIADNHNNFNLTIFTQDGTLVSALESKVKHAQCFDVALMDDGSVVLASKDYRLYIYRYVQVPPIGL